MEWASSSPFSLEVEHVVKGMCLLAKAQFEHHTLVFINIYAPTNGTERKSFLEIINARLNCCGSEVILFWGGDFYCTEFLESLIQPPNTLDSWSILMALWMCREECTQTADSTQGPT